MPVSSSSGRKSNNWRNTLRKLTESELERKKIVKIKRTMIRLKHSLRADEEINSVLPKTVGEFDAALERGELKTIEALDTTTL